MAPQSRIKQEQLRKRRNNLLRRHNDFWRLYAIRSWVVLEMPNGRIYTYQSHPHVPTPNDKEMDKRPQPVVHKTPASYLSSPSLIDLVIPQPPRLAVLGRQSKLWDSLYSQNDDQSRAPLLSQSPGISSLTVPVKPRDITQVGECVQWLSDNRSVLTINHWSSPDQLIRRKVAGQMRNPVSIGPGDSMSIDEHMKHSMDQFTIELLHLISSSQADAGCSPSVRQRQRARRMARLRYDAGSVIEKSTTTRLYDRARRAGTAFLRRQIRAIQRRFHEESAVAYEMMDNAALLRAIAERHPRYAKPIWVIGLVKQYMPRDFRLSTAMKDRHAFGHAVLMLVRNWLSQGHSEP
ncbi:hypothetical protein FE257_005558 [Aspergillus nanangensis]|uniref:Uncharacterized protein n=1 Tax=Aspergillus nanangensis TaxID=2582783 RepID=A0AAD4CQN5_ASPNN|nr:hypothetical protein FE257_005558 [Aspergillus nanangensis]